MKLKNTDSGYNANQPNFWNVVPKLTMKARLKMFNTLMGIIGQNINIKILDVGVTSEEGLHTNFLEKLYPFRENITAVGLESSFPLRTRYQGIKYIQANGFNLPFADKSFDLVTSFAVIEHVGSSDNQRKLVEELCRVGKTVLVTTPNRWYPVEVHTLMPFIHWLPVNIFRRILKILGQEFYSNKNNLNLLDVKKLRSMFPGNMSIREYNQRFFGFMSNMFFVAK